MTRDIGALKRLKPVIETLPAQTGAPKAERPEPTLRAAQTKIPPKTQAKTHAKPDAPAKPLVLSPQDAPPVDMPARDAPIQPALGPRRRRRSFWLSLLFWAGGAVTTALLVDAMAGLATRIAALHPSLGWAAWGVLGLAGLALAALALKELAALGRIRRIGRIAEKVAAARASGTEADLAGALRSLEALYARRRDLAWAKDRARAAARSDTPRRRLDAFEREALGALDQRARAEVSTAAGQLAVATAIAPSAVLDALAALYLNLRMIRRISEIYGGRGGALGTLRLARRVVAQAMAAGLIAAGQDLLAPLFGGGVVSKLSRRAGEGMINGALTARLGLAAIEICRPAPFSAARKPTLADVAWQAMKRGGAAETQDG